MFSRLFNFLSFVAVSFFLSRKRTVIKELQEKHRQYQAITNAIKESIITTDNNGIIVDCNNSTQTIFQWRKKELVGKNVYVLLSPEVIENKNIFEDSGRFKLFDGAIDIEGLRKDGTRIPIALSVVSVKIDDRLYFCAVARDIEHRKNNEKQIHLLNETLKLRVSALEAFQFSVVHDLNAPLRSMEGFSEILVEDFSNELGEEGKDYINRIRVSVKRMRQLIDDMFRLSRITQVDIQMNKEQIDLSEMALDILKYHVENYKCTHRKYQFKIQPDITGYGDKELIRIALLNILSNAWKFTCKNDEAIIEFGATIIDNETVYYVKDNGVGFDMAEVDKLFKPFSRLHKKDDFEGNGVGLTITKQIIILHEGKIWAEGEVGKGATFYFTIGTNKYA